MQKVFLILSTGNIGGAEKRFVGLWQSICGTEKDIAIFLVIDPKLYEALIRQEGDSNVIHSFGHRIIQYELSGRFKKFRKAVKKFVDQHTGANDILHFVGDHPLLPLLKRKQVYSITQSSLKNLNLFGRIGQLGGAWMSDQIDILDPVIFDQLSKWFFIKRNNIHRTSNSFCDVELFYSFPFEQKKDWMVFLGRFESMKQVKELLQMVPFLYGELKEKAKKDLHFYFFGHGSLEEELKQMLDQSEFKNIPVTVSYNNTPQKILRESKIFFSVQLHNNYPSRSLIEAMSAGNIPVVTDIGQTRWLAKPEFSYYVPEKFTREDMLSALQKLYGNSCEELADKSAKARQFVKDEHTIERMREYYLKLYHQV